MNIPTIIEGNTFALAIPLQVYAIEDDELVLHDYVPAEGDNVTIGLKGARRNYSYTPTFSNNIAFVALGGNELCGIYAVEVAIVKDDGTKLTSFKGQQLKIVKSIDELTTTEIVDGVSQNVLYLDPEIFIAGKDGRGIVSIVKTATSGLVDTYTITYTDNTTSTFNVTNGAQGANGQDGADGVGIASIAKTSSVGLVDTYTITLTNSTTYTFTVTNGKDGADGEDGTDGVDGVGIVSIAKTSTSGLVDTYTITLTNGQTYNFNVTNGKDGEDAQPPYFVNLTWDNSTQKYTADKTPEECQNAYEAGQIVIFRDRGTYQSVNTFEWLMSTSQYYPQPNLRMVFAYRIEGKDNDGNLRISQLHYQSQIVTTLTVTTITAQQLLESGVNIKTINSTSLLGSGNIAVQAPLTFDNTPTANSSNPVKSGGVYTALSGKVDHPLEVAFTMGSGNTYTADKTIAEIFNAHYNEGRQVNFRYDGYLMTPLLISPTMLAYYAIYGVTLIVIQGATENDADVYTVENVNLQTQLVSGTSIKTINSTSLLGSGNISVVSQAELTNYCPIIEDTRSSNVAAITGDAPFGTNGTIPDGQRIYIHFKYVTANNSTLTLTLSDETTTSAIPLKASYHNSGNYNVDSDLKCNAGSYMPFIYNATDSVWHSLGDIDYFKVPPLMNAAFVQAGTSTIGFIISPKLFHDNAYIVEESYSSGSLKANKMYDFGTVSTALTIPSLDATNDLVSNVLNFYALRFIAGADNLSITFPSGVEVDDTPTINTGDYVEIMINLYVVNSTNKFYASIKVWQAQ